MFAVVPSSQPFRRWIGGALLLILFVVTLSGCNMPDQSASETPTMDVTQAYQTVEARLTEAVAQTPSPTVSPTITETPTPTQTVPPTANLTPQLTSAQASPTSRLACDQAGAGSPIDVTIPDDTVIQPGQPFSKTWRLRNSGTCDWNTGYAIVFFSGERLGAPASVPIPAVVAPGSTVDVTVDMIAPTQPGTYQSNWKLRNASGVLFGIGPGDGLPFYVRIVVPAPTTLTPTINPSLTITVTPSPAASGAAILFPGDRIDLDSNQVNGASGQDLNYVRDDTAGTFNIVPQSSAVISVYGGFLPSRADCQAASLNASPVNLGALSLGTYVCYSTDAGRTGYLRLNGFNADNGRADLQVYTWANP